MTLESVTLMRDSTMAAKLIQLLQEKTDQTFGFAINHWFQWLWSQ